MRYLGFSIILMFLLPAMANAQEKKLIQLTGKVTDELLRPLPFAHILILDDYRGAITNNYGSFSLVVEENDTVLVSSVGYKSKRLHIPEGHPTNFMNVDVILQMDTLFIQEAVIYPWRTYEEFKQAFLNLELPDDDMERARRNIALIRTQIIMDQEPSARANFQYIMEQQYQETFIRGTYPTYQLFNAVAWAKFFQALRRGDFKFGNDDR
ncbi:MAG: carboxypeptidase-like regulatory domain-containing protein [Bacteroidales bacterium]|nr:carboxypeptidase-like regulatory domain-containing protein [Bacteroidales bacterium]